MDAQEVSSISVEWPYSIHAGGLAPKIWSVAACLRYLAMASLESAVPALIALSLIVGGCTNPNAEQSSTPQPQPSARPPEQSPPLKLALATPTTVANPQVEQYLAQLAAPNTGQGIWIQTQGTLLANHQGTIPLPAASLTKVATSLAILKELGPDHRFTTNIGYIGTLQKGELQGDLVIEGGADPFFVWENAIALGNLLNQNGIRQIRGNVIVVGPFYMNYETDPITAGTLFLKGLNYTRWPAEAQTQYQTLPPDTPKPEIAITGRLQAVPARLGQVTPLIRHRSLPVAELLKKMNQYSNNAMAEMLADQVGGPRRVAQLAAQASNVPLQEIQLVNGSGLSIDNRISARAACGMFQAIAHLLHSHKMTIADVFAIIGKDAGVLNERPLPTLAVIKSGTLDGVSALAGALPTQDQGVIWFALVNGEGNVDRLRTQQERLLQTLLQIWGLTTKPFAQLTANASRRDQTTISEIVK